MWRRRWTARLPTGPLLLVLAGAIALVPLRTSTGDPGLDPASAAPVVVATVRLESGTVVDDSDVEVRSIPLVALPAGVTDEPDRVVGRQVTATIFAGEPVPDGRLAPDGLVGVAAATPAGRSAFALPADAGQPPVVVDQQVDLYAVEPIGSLDPLGDSRARDPSIDDTSTGGGARRIARSAIIVAVDDQRITVAVDPSEAAAVAGALIDSTVVLAVTGPEVGP